MHLLLNFLLFLFLFNSTYSQLKRKSLRAYPLAKCNNGSPASFYFTAGNLKNPNLLIHLQGGGKCSSEAECKKRCTKDKPSLCKTKTAKTITQDLPSFSNNPETNPAFHNFLRVFVPYCSSDLYMGTGNVTYGNNKKFFFHGRHIIDAIVKDIIKNKPNVGNMKQIVLMGTSAGGFGVAANCDFVADQFHAVNKNIDVRCISDGGDFVPNVEPTEGCDPNEADEETGNLWQPVADQSCMDSLPTGSKQCFKFSSYYDFIKTPFMVVGNYIDPTVRGPCTPKLNEQKPFWDNYKQEVRAMAVRYIGDKPQNAIFLSNCPFHVSVNRPFAWEEMDVSAVNGQESLLYKNVISNWLTGDGPYQAMDSPTSLNPKCPQEFTRG
eukprot:TRINITY_DN10700_c0_g1_i1.p1 TRINITY_DN10700_c0_g1~~TRINITY_DN10700_c0_g1_i1.p1  ORF type:complete len:379 (-),score=67.34 TRINITY_DN10700_c0_g1_i1:64-1200(-)